VIRWAGAAGVILALPRTYVCMYVAEGLLTCSVAPRWPKLSSVPGPTHRENFATALRSQERNIVVISPFLWGLREARRSRSRVT